MIDQIPETFFEQQDRDDVLELRFVEKRLSTESLKELQGYLQIIASRQCHIVLNFENVHYLGIVILDALIRFNQMMKVQKRRLIMINIHSQIEDLHGRTRLNKLFIIADDIVDAVMLAHTEHVE